MKHIFVAFLFYSFLVASCKKEIAVTKPQASFSFRGDTTSLFEIVTNDTCTLINNSVNADSSFWDLGNGNISKKKNLVLTYPKSGTYNIKLTVTNGGQSSSVIKTVKVVDRVLRKIIIKNVSWDTIPNHIPGFNYMWPTSSTAGVYVQIQKFSDGDSTAPYNLLPNSPILYKSPIIKNVYCNTTTPIVIDVPGRFVIDKNMVLNGTAFRVFLLATDSNNVIYNLQSRFESGVSFGILEENLQKNKFILSFSLTSSVEFDCDFE